MNTRLQPRSAVAEASGEVVFENAFVDFRAALEVAFTSAEQARAGAPGERFEPPFDLPARSVAIDAMTDRSGLAVRFAGSYEGKRIWVMDLTMNEHIRTTKTFGSLAIVLRAVAHVQRTGERVMIITPSAANKASALRAAVAAAHASGAVERDQLMAAVVVPDSAMPKLWNSALGADAEARRQNPIFRFTGPNREGVKGIVRDVMDTYAAELRRDSGVRLWDSLHVDNYKVADVIRAVAEREALGPAGEPRLHVHAVSSAYGMLGHALGRSQMNADDAPPAYMMVQHLATPDLVLWSHFGRIDERDLPDYRHDPAAGVWRQASSPYFPPTAEAMDEIVEPTFYTRRPPTLPLIERTLEAARGRGMVVSRAECRGRYPEVRELLERGLARPIATELETVRELAAVMSLVGVLNGVDRGLVPEDDIVVHGSGFYTDDDIERVPVEQTISVSSAENLYSPLRAAVAR